MEIEETFYMGIPDFSPVVSETNVTANDLRQRIDIRIGV